MLETLHHFSSLFAQNNAAQGGIMALGLGMDLVIIVVATIIIGYPFYVIAQRQGHATPWFAFIPILQTVLLVQLADLEIWWVIVCLLCGIATIWPLMKICEKVGKPSWIAILMLVPCVGIFVPYYIAFG